MHCEMSYLHWFADPFGLHVAVPPLYMSLISVHGVCVDPSQSSPASTVPSPHIVGGVGSVHCDMSNMHLSVVHVSGGPSMKWSNHVQLIFVDIPSSHCSPLSNIARSPPVQLGAGFDVAGVHAVVLNMQLSHLSVPLVNPKSVHDVIFPQSLFAPLPSHCSFPWLFVILSPQYPAPLLQLSILNESHPMPHDNVPFGYPSVYVALLKSWHESPARSVPSHNSPASFTLFPQNGLYLHCEMSYWHWFADPFGLHVAVPPLYMSLMFVHGCCDAPSHSSPLSFSISPSPHIAGGIGV